MGNTVIQSQGSLVVDGGNSSSVTISGNTVTQHQPVGYALSLLGMDEAVVTDNTFTGVGTPAADATALSVTASTNSTVITATGNTFTNLSRALRFVDQAVTANG